MFGSNTVSHHALPDPFSDAFIDGLDQGLRARELLDDFGLRRARRAQSQSGERFDLVLSRLGLVTDHALTGVLADLLVIPHATPDDFPQHALYAEALQLPFLKANHILPIDDDGMTIVLATSDPFNNDAIAALAYLLDKPITLRLASAGDIERHIERLYGAKHPREIAAALPSPTSTDENGVSCGGADDSGGDDIRRLEDMASEAPVIKLVQTLVSRAVAVTGLRHPHRTARRQRARALPHRRRAADRRNAAADRSRRAWLAHQDHGATEHRRAPPAARRPDQSHVSAATTSICACRPCRRSTARASCCAFSIAQASISRFQRLDFRAADSTAFEKLLQEPNGIILVTGPTGSGKTTTLYTALSGLNDSRTQAVHRRRPNRVSAGRHQPDPGRRPRSD